MRFWSDLSYHMAGRYLTQMLQILQLAVLAVGTDGLTDWERDNFGVRTEHHKDDLINKVNLDENAPKIVKTHKRQRHLRKPPRNHERQRINFRVRGRDLSREFTEKPSAPTRNYPGSQQRNNDDPEPFTILSDNNNFAASIIRDKPSFADFKENYFGLTKTVESSEDEVRSYRAGTE